MLQRLRRLISRSAPDEMKPGDQYCRIVGHRFLETATILDLRPDLVGIPHVHFSLAVERSDADSLAEGPRTLAVSRFVGEFRKRLG
jgi:hypothetical protein